jgi:hypothetical protein
LQVISSYYAPAPDFLPLFHPWLYFISSKSDTEYKSIALHIFHNVSITSNAPRRIPASLEEITFMEVGRPLSVQIHFAERYSKRVPVSPCTRVDDIHSNLCSKMEIKNFTEFGIFYKHNNQGTHSIQ